MSDGHERFAQIVGDELVNRGWMEPVDVTGPQLFSMVIGAFDELDALRAKLAAAEEQVEWSHNVLDMFFAPRTIYNSYDRTEEVLTLAGRIQRAMNPSNAVTYATGTNEDALAPNGE